MLLNICKWLGLGRDSSTNTNTKMVFSDRTSYWLYILQGYTYNTKYQTVYILP